MRKRAILAARVSTDPQAKYGYSLATQLHAMRQYAQAHDFEIMAEVQDDCSGTIPLRDRPGGTQIYSLIDKRAADALIFYTVDRATRDEDLIELAVLRRDLRQAGIELHFCDSGQSDLTALGGMIDHVKAEIAADERKKIMERTKRGRKAKSQSGKWVGAGPEPYGYRRSGMGKDVQLVIYEPEALVVRRIYVMYVGTEGQRPIPMRRMGEVLNREGVPSPGRADKSGPGPGRGWWIATIRQILRRRVYIGELEYNGGISNMPELAIVDRDLFNKAQERTEQNKHIKWPRRYEYLLSGRFMCTCGGYLSGATKVRPTRIHRYYHCSCLRESQSLRLCHERYVRADELEARVWEWLHDIMSDEAKLLHGLTREAERNAADNQPKLARIDALVELIERGERKLKRLVKDASEDDNEDYVAATRAEAKATSRQLAAYRKERDRLQAEIRTTGMTEAERDRFLATAAQLRQGMPNADFETQRYFIERMDVQSKLRRDENGKRWADVTCGFTLDSGAIPIDGCRCTS